MLIKIKAFFLLMLFCWSACAPKGYVLQEFHYQAVPITDTIAPEVDMQAFVQVYKIHLDSVMNEVVGISEVPMTKAQPESTLGNFAADAQLEAGRKIDNLSSISVVNYGGLRIPFVGKGELTKGKIYEVMPFDNMLTIVEIPGTVLKVFCDHMAARKGWPVSGLSFTIKDGKATGILVNGEPLKENTVYKLVTSDYIANGGDECEFLLPLNRRSSTVFLRDAMIEKARRDTKAEGGLRPKLENRVTYAE